ncbi:unnamed protein product [Schistosoma mattheei]|uniref:Uncharacterized protein n=1 Tax=Schistosoma mattheei TaxID=31246 RepID=A0A3P8EYP9_9TREM|nr:unnamed protein product [Schistosoma mattheei]
MIQKSWDSISYEIKQAYNKIKIRYALMFERNIYCGPFSIYVLLERQPNQPLCKRRVIHVDNRSHWLAHCEGRSQQRTIKFIDITMKAHLNRVWLIGHAGSVKTLWLDIKLQILLSGSYDTSIRLWNLSDNNNNNNNNQHCLNQQTNLLNPIIWRLDEQKPLWIMKHSTPITSVGLRGYICTTGEHSGRINVWRIGNKKPILIKVLTGHTDVITALRFDNYHLVTSSRDKSVKIWSIIGEFSDCIGTLVHTG